MPANKYRKYSQHALCLDALCLGQSCIHYARLSFSTSTLPGQRCILNKHFAWAKVYSQQAFRLGKGVFSTSTSPGQRCIHYARLLFLACIKGKRSMHIMQFLTSHRIFEECHITTVCFVIEEQWNAWVLFALMLSNVWNLDFTRKQVFLYF